MTLIRTVKIQTPAGLGSAEVHRRPGAFATLVLGHGAGGSGWPADVRAVTAAAVDAGWAVALLNQPWRLAGRKIAPAPSTLDIAWLPMVEALRTGRSHLPGPLVVGGRSAGARVACRTAEACGATGVLALSFPLHPPGRPGRSRADELRRPLDAGLGLHVVQGATDPFGTPGELVALLPGAAYVTAVPGTHTLERSAVAVAVAGLGFLERVREPDPA